MIIKPNIRLLQNIAIISAVLAVLLCVLIIVNYLQLQRADPLNTKALNSMVDQLQANPENQQLRDQIRELDLLARRAFFTNQWQVKTGGLLLFCSILVIIICLQIIEYFRHKLPEVPDSKKFNIFELRKISRNWIAGAGIFLFVTAFIFAWLSHNELGREIDIALLMNSKSADSSERFNGIEKNSAQELDGNTNDSPDSNTVASSSSVDGFPGIQEIRSNFTSFRGPGGNGIAWQKNIPVNWDGKSGKNIKWKTNIPLQGYNSPIVWKDKLFLSGANEKTREVYCLDVNSGKLVWKTTVDKIPGSPGQAPKVNIETGFSAPTLTTDGRRVYAIFANGDLIALNMEGEKVWSKNLGLPKNHYGHSSSLMMFQDKLIVQYDQSGSASITALAGKTGDVIWNTPRKVRISWASPIVVNTGSRVEIILAADPSVASYDAVTGKELWKIDCISGEVGPSLAYADGIVYAVNEYSKLSAIQIGDTPKILWEDTEYLSDVPSPVATENYLFLTTSYGTVACYEAKTGKKLWEKEFGNKVYSSPVLVEGKIYLLDSKGIMHIFKADKIFTSIAEPQLGEGSFCTPAFADGMIFLRGNKNIYCISK